MCKSCKHMVLPVLYLLVFNRLKWFQMALRALSSFFFRFEKHGSKHSLTLPVQCSSILCLVFMFLPGLLLLILHAFTQRRHPFSLKVSDTPVLGEVPFLSAPCGTFCFFSPALPTRDYVFFCLQILIFSLTTDCLRAGNTLPSFYLQCF